MRSPAALGLALALCLSPAAAGAQELSYQAAHQFWTVHCFDDRLEDARNCVVNNGNLYVHVAHTGRLFISVGRDHYPGKNSALRVDGGGVRRWDPDRGMPEAWIFDVVAELRAGAVALTRYYQWPRDAAVDQDVTLKGFTAALDDAVRAAKTYRP